MDLQLSGKVAIVTGGSKGIGRAVAMAMLREGAAVLVCARGQAALDETAALAAPLGGRLLTMQADLTQQEAAGATAARCLEAFGRIDILVNNAGSARRGPFLQLSDQAWLDDWTLKFFGFVRMARAVYPHMKERGQGVIVNVIGNGGLMPSANYMIGGAINAALNHFTKALADEGVSHGVRVVGVNPGAVLTDRFEHRIGPNDDREEIYRQCTPMGRPAMPEEVADLVLFLASERARFITRSNVTIDGGHNNGLMG
ncbi:MAG TPA: SDR family oxidoreductase [Candidatus Binataceae bacterium]|nr:SDR family oxidoreductase [Candidatus Binataceae bacterium]